MEGRRHALLIGVTYYGTEYALPGCLNDVQRIAGYLRRRKFDTITVMHDELAMNNDLYPTRTNVFSRIYRLVRDLGEDGHLYIHFSGHGFHIAEKNAVLADGATISNNSTQCILMRNADRAELTDIHEHNALCDEQIVRVFDHLQPTARVFMTVDACASGNLFDLQWNVQWKGGSVRKFKAEEQATRSGGKNTKKQIVILTAVKEEKYAWDVAPKHSGGGNNNKSYGVFTDHLFNLLEEADARGKKLQYYDLLYYMAKYLMGRSEPQDPQMSLSYLEIGEQMLWI